MRSTASRLAARLVTMPCLVASLAWAPSARADDDAPVAWFETTPFRRRALWEIGALGGASITKVSGQAHAEPSPGAALALEGLYRREINPWTDVDLGLRVASSTAPGTLTTFSLLMPARFDFGKAWPRRGRFLRSPTRATFGAGPVFMTDALASRGVSERLGGCVLAGLSQGMPYAKGDTDVFVEADVCGVTAGNAGVDLSPTFFWIGTHVGRVSRSASGP